MGSYMLMTMALHGMVDLFLMMGANQLCGYPQQWKRMLLGVMLGCLHLGACLQPGFHFLGNGFWRIVVWILTVMTAFGDNISALRRGIVFSVMRLAILGVLDGKEESFWTAVLSASVIYLLSLIGFGDGAGKHYLPVSISYEGKRADFTALLDTGNMLSDPLTGQSVLIVSSHVAQKLLQLAPEQIADPVTTMEKGLLPGLRLIPYHAVGKSGGLLLGMRFQNVQIGDHYGPQIVAFAPQTIGEGKTFQALAGGII